MTRATIEAWLNRIELGSWAVTGKCVAWGLVILALTTFYAVESRAGLGFEPPKALSSTAGSDGARTDRCPAVEGDGQGSWVAAWVGHTVTSPIHSGIFVSRSLNAGASWTSPQFYPWSSSLSVDCPDLATDGRGNWVIVFSYASVSPSTNATWANRSIGALRSNNNGGSWSYESVRSGGSGNQDRQLGPQVAVDEAGNWIVVWGSQWSAVVPGSNLGPDYDIVAAYSSDSGNTWSSPEAVNTNANTDSGGDSWPSVVNTGVNNDWAVAWFSQEPMSGTGSDSDIFYARKSQVLLGISVWSVPTPVDSTATTDGHGDISPRIVSGKTGAWVRHGADFRWHPDSLGVVWRSANTTSNWQIEFARHQDCYLILICEPWLDPVVLKSGGRNTVPEIVVDADRSWAAVWGAPGASGTEDDIELKFSTDDGITWSSGVVQTNSGSDSGDDLSPSIAFDGQNSWVAVWATAENLGGSIGTDTDIAVARVIAPRVGGITRWSPANSVTDQQTVQFRVSFTESVTGVGTGDFAVDASGLSGAAVTAVSGSGSARTVTVNRGSGAGTIGLSVVDDDTINDSRGTSLGSIGQGNGDYTSTQQFTIDVPPSVQSIVRQSPPGPATLDGVVQFRVTFDQHVSGVGTSDFQVRGTLGGAAAVSVTPVQAGNYVDVSVTTGTTSGTLRLDLIDNDSIRDDQGHALGGWGVGDGTYTAGQSYVVDRTPPDSSGGVVASATGPYTVSDTSLTFEWLQDSFLEDNPGVNPISSFLVALTTSATPPPDTAYVPADQLEEHAFDAPPGSPFPHVEHWAWVKAVNLLGLLSAPVSASVIIDTNQIAVGGDILAFESRKAWVQQDLGRDLAYDDVDWANTIITPNASSEAIRLDHAKLFIAGNPQGSFQVTWRFNVLSDCNGDGTPSLTEDCPRDYTTSTEPDPSKEVMGLYHTHVGGTPTDMPRPDVSAVPFVTIHYNTAVPCAANPAHCTNPPVNPADDTRYIWQEGGLFGARERSGLIIVHYDHVAFPSQASDFIGYEIVDMRPDAPEGTGHVEIGSRLRPSAPVVGDEAFVRRGGAGGTPEYVYQHAVEGAPQRAVVWAIAENDPGIPGSSFNIELVWKRPGLWGVMWPYEIRRYTTGWPSGSPAKYQPYVRGDAGDDPASAVAISPELNAQLVNESFPGAFHAYLAGGSSFYTDNPGSGEEGWALLQYGTGPVAGLDWVGFEVVRALDHLDAEVYVTDTASIGVEITDGHHDAAVAPHIHESAGTRYAPGVYADTGQVYAVNTGELEVWWYSETRRGDREGAAYPDWPVEAAQVAWPSKAVRYTAQWPTAGAPCASDDDPAVPCRLVIASQKGSEALDPGIYGPDAAVYLQNDDAGPGFNPNDEHALKLGDTVYALRDDLGAPETSEPWVLLQYREQSGAGLWRFRLLQVVAEEDPWFFHEWGAGFDLLTDPYKWEAGIPLQAPYPLATLPNVDMQVVDTGTPGVGWTDREGNVYARAAGDDGVSPESMTLRISYALQDDFYFPDSLGVSYPHDPASHDVVPWLDAGSGTPADVVYSAYWPSSPNGLLSVGQTVVDGGPGIDVVNGRCSVEVIYDQSLATGGGESALLVDPITPRLATQSLGSLPPTIRTERVVDNLGRNLDVFPDLSLALRQRVALDSATGLLEMFGVIIDPTFGYQYPLLNVMSLSERDELCSLDDADPEAPVKCTGTEWDDAVESLHAAANEPVTDITVPWGPVALTGRFVPETRYVTLAYQNAAECGLEPEAGPPSLAIMQVEPTLYTGAVNLIYPDCAFDESVTLRHSGDFGGHPEDYVFEWRAWSDPSTTPPTPVGDNPTGWLHEATGAGEIEVRIAGAGLRTLSDGYFAVRYGYDDGDGTPAEWSAWADPAFSEGWIKRVVGDIDGYTQGGTSGGVQGGEILGPIEQGFHSYGGEVDTVVSMIGKAGARWTGSVPLACRDLDQFGLIEIYETVLNRGADLSINASYNDDGANKALLLVASRIADLYTLLGNESFADASDPTIGWVDKGDYGSEAVTSVHAFANVTESLLEEELGLLRGRDDAHAEGVQLHPLYNRLAWNYTNGLTGGEVAYSLNYNVHDTNDDGVIDEDDAKTIFPQAHGDAWGHYLTALSTYYQLLRHPNYTWKSQSEAVQMGGQAFSVDYYDERKFARVAAGKARAGAEIVNMTYRDAYVEDPGGQWQGYRDIDPDRAWGVAEWASRAGQGAYFDWVTGNAILPDIDPQSCDLPGADLGTCHSGVEEVDRRKVLELRDLASRYGEIQAQMDVADVGLNPLGLATNVVPFDIEPTEIDAGNTHFEQIYDRAVGAMNNAIAVFDHANGSTQMLRRQAESAADFQQAVGEQEIDFRNRLIESFGYPYSDDIGAGRTYPAGYDGPDIVHYNMVDVSEILGVAAPDVTELTVTLKTLEVSSTGSLSEVEQDVVFYLASSAEPYGEVKPESWTGQRRAPGEIQMARSDLLQARNRFQQALEQYDDLLEAIDDQLDILRAQYRVNAEEIEILNWQLGEQQDLSSRILSARAKQLDFRGAARIANIAAAAAAEILPTAVGLATDVTAPVRGAIRLVGSVMSEFMSQNADQAVLEELGHQQALQEMQAGANIQLRTAQSGFALEQQIKQLEQTVRRETAVRLELFGMQEATQQAVGRYRAALARGLRLLEDRDRFGRQTAAEVQERRYKDMAFRIFRNDALQKYRAQFDLAARYVYLAAKAYDFETGFLSSDSQAGSRFLTDIVRARLIGTIQSGIPQTGGGLADPMARMSANFVGLKGQLGFNNPQRETNRFSLRSELFRIRPGFQGNETWRETLRRHVVPNLLDLPEFQRYARIFEPHGVTEPAIVIPFETSVHFGLNFFGWPAGGGDNAYDSTNFATKVRSVGVWFSNYNNLSMVNTPRVYLIPVGADVIRSPSGGGVTRIFDLLDQKLPASFDVGGGDLADPDWIPMVDGLRDSFAEVRKYSSFRAYHDAGQFDPNEVARDSRLVGRSVWNSRWLLVIPAGTLLFDRQEGLNRFIDGMPFGDGRDGNGVVDILIFFETYAYSGN